MLIQPGQTQTPLINVNPREAPSTINSGTQIKVQYTASISEDVTGLIITEELPNQFQLINSTSTPPADATKINQTTNEMKWLFFKLQEKNAVTIEYFLQTPTQIEPGTYNLKGSWSAITSTSDGSGQSPTSTIQIINQNSQTPQTPTNSPLDSTYIIAIIGIIATIITIVLLLTRRSRS